MAKPIPDGYHTITPYLSVKGADRLITFLEKAFEGKVVRVSKASDGRIMNAEMKIGDSMLMIGDVGNKDAPGAASLYLYVKDCDDWYHRAIAAGATSISEPADMFYGDRHGGVKDPTGNLWWVATHKEDISDEEMARRVKQAGR